MRMSVDLGPEAVAGARTTVAISPDGTHIAFPIRGAGGTRQLATRLMDQATPTALPGTENAEDAFFSPDGQWIGFFADGKLKKISVPGGAAAMLCGAPNTRGGTWAEDGNIIASLGTNAGLSRVPAVGGVPQPLTKVSREETSHRWPQALPGSSAILFTAGTRLAQFVEGDIDVVSLKTGEVKTVARGGSYGRFLPTRGSMGHLVYVHEGVLFSAPFDPVKLETLGTPVPVLEDMASDPTSGGGQFEFSGSGTFIYRSGRAEAHSYPVMWLDGSAKTQPLLPMPGIYNSPRFSPDGRRLALVAGSSKGRDAYVYDLQRDTLTRLTFTGQGNNPVWSPDGKHILFWSTGSFWWIRADGAGEAQKLLESKNGVWVFPSSFSPDGRRLAYTEVAPDTGTDIWTLPLDLTDAEHPKPGKPEPFLRTSLDEGAPVFSPDGRWVSYVSSESGRLEVYVRPFQGPGGKWQISTGGGMHSFWSRDGRQLFYETPDHARIMVVDYTASGDALAPGKPRVWSEAQARSFPAGNPPLDLAPDGKRFAILPRDDPSEAQTGLIHVTFLLNFFDELRRRVPAGGKN